MPLVLDDSGLEIIADEKSRTATEVRIHVNMRIDPSLLLHISECFSVAQHTERKRGNKQVTWLLFVIV